MTAYISPFDDRFLTFGRAARLVAKDHLGLDSAEVMDMLARAIFAGAFDPPAVNLSDDEALKQRDAPENWLHIPIETPPPSLTPAQATLKPKPQQFFGANRSTVAIVMESIDALPGAAGQWQALLHDPARPQDRAEAFSALAGTPLTNYPEAGRRFLEGVYIPREKLRRWFELRQIPLPRFLWDSAIGPASGAARPARSHPATTSEPRGRPQKAAWRAIAQSLLKLRAENPSMQKKALAFEAWKRAAQEFDEADLPSVATIQRKMGELLRDQLH